MLVKRAFGVTLGPDDGVTLAKARQISSVQALRMQSNEFLDKIGARVVRSLGGGRPGRGH